VFRSLSERKQDQTHRLSEVGVEQIERGAGSGRDRTVQNVYSLANRKHDNVLAHCESSGIGFIPFWPLHLRPWPALSPWPESPFKRCQRRRRSRWPGC